MLNWIRIKISPNSIVLLYLFIYLFIFQLKRRALLQSLPPKLTFCFEKSNATKMEVCLELKNGEGELLLEPRSFVLRFIKVS